MIYLKSVLAGLMAAIAAPLVYVLCQVILAWSASAPASGGIVSVSAGVDEGPLLLAILTAFVGGFLWTLRRLSRKRATG